MASLCFTLVMVLRWQVVLLVGLKYTHTQYVPKIIKIIPVLLCFVVAQYCTIYLCHSQSLLCPHGNHKMDLIHKSHYAPVPYPTMHHVHISVLNGALRDREQMHCGILWDGSIVYACKIDTRISYEFITTQIIAIQQTKYNKAYTYLNGNTKIW